MTAKEKLQELIRLLPEREAARALVLLAPLMANEPFAAESPREPMDDESREWLEAAAEVMGRRLDELEADVPAEELAAWKDSFEEFARPCRYVPGQGFVAS